MCRVNAWPVFCPQWFFPLSLLHVSGLCKNTYALLSPIFLQSVPSRSLPPPSPISFCVHLPSHLFEAGRCERNTCLTCKDWGTAVSVPCVCLHEGVRVCCWVDLVMVLKARKALRDRTNFLSVCFKIISLWVHVNTFIYLKCEHKI